MQYICIPHCTVADVETIIKIEPFREWLSSVHRLVLDVVRQMILDDVRPEATNIVDSIAHAIWNHARTRGVASDKGMLMNATLSEGFFTINIPIGKEYGLVRMERHSNRDAVQVNLNFPDPVTFMTQLAHMPVGDTVMHFDGIHPIRLREVAFLLWCEKLKPGLSAPFRDMISEDGGL